MLKYGFKLEPQQVKYKIKLNCMYQGLQIRPLIEYWLFVTPSHRQIFLSGPGTT